MGDRHPFHFATGATALIHHLGGPLRNLRKHFPQLAIDIVVCPTEEMVAGLLERRFDLALISLPYPNDNVETITLFEEELLVLKPSPARIRGWHVAPTEPAELVKVPFVLYPKRSNMRSMIDGFFKEIGVTPRVMMEADDTEALKKLVETGFGYSIPRAARQGPPVDPRAGARHGAHRPSARTDRCRRAFPANGADGAQEVAAGQVPWLAGR